MKQRLRGQRHVPLGGWWSRKKKCRRSWADHRYSTSWAWLQRSRRMGPRNTDSSGTLENQKQTWPVRKENGSSCPSSWTWRRRQWQSTSQASSRGLQWLTSRTPSWTSPLEATSSLQRQVRYNCGCGDGRRQEEDSGVRHLGLRLGVIAHPVGDRGKWGFCFRLMCFLQKLKRESILVLLSLVFFQMHPN